MAVSIIDEITRARRSVRYWDDELQRFTVKKRQGLALTVDEINRARSVRLDALRLTPDFAATLDGHYQEVDWLAFECVINKSAEQQMHDRLVDDAAAPRESREERHRRLGFTNGRRR
jgi:hypothetical protein